jgi:hypothetical protein
MGAPVQELAESAVKKPPGKADIGRPQPYLNWRSFPRAWCPRVFCASGEAKIASRA